MPIPNQQRLIELLAEYIIKADRYFERADQVDKRLEAQGKKFEEKFDAQNEKFNKQHEFLMEQSKRMDVMLQTLIRHSEHLEKIDARLLGLDQRLQKIESR
jgi:hypothetical protein